MLLLDDTNIVFLVVISTDVIVSPIFQTVLSLMLLGR